MKAEYTPRNTTYINGGQSYVVRSNDDVINVNSTLGATTIYLPNIAINGSKTRKIFVNDTGNSAATNPITLVAVGGDLVNGNISLLLDANRISAQIVIVNNNEYLANLSSDSSTPPVGASFGSISGSPSAQLNLQDGTIQGGAFSPTNAIVALGDSFRTAFQKLQGQITAIIAAFVPLVSTNYVIVKATGIGTINGAALISALTSAQALTPNGTALSATNRAIVYLFVGRYDLGSNFLSIGQFVDIVVLGNPQDVIITSSNATGTIQIANTNDYIIKNCTINNTGAGGSITHNASQTDNGIWDGLILGAYNTEGTIFSGDYLNLVATSDNILSGDISGTVKNCSFQSFSCGYNSTNGVTISGDIEDCTSSGNRGFGCSGNAPTQGGDVIISGTIKNCSSTGITNFGFSFAGAVTISGTTDNCISSDYSFGNSFDGALVTISGTIKNSKSTGSTGDSFGCSIGQCLVSGIIDNCSMVGNRGFGFGEGAAGCVISGTIKNCTGGDSVFGHSNFTCLISGTIKNCTGGDGSFGWSFFSPSSEIITGEIENCMAIGSTNGSFGGTSATGIIINCTRGSGYGTHKGTIERCSFSENHATNPTLTLAAGAIVKYSTIYQAGAGECFDAAGAINASVYLCAANKAVEASLNITNNITIPNNVIDANIIL